MTFAILWKSLRTAWQSRPFAIILPLVALGWYWYRHGHVLAIATYGNGGSLPAWPDLIAGVALLTTKFERLTALFLGAPAPETLPAPVASPVLVKGPGDVPKIGGLMLLLGLGLALNGCATVTNIVKDATTCAGPDCQDVITKILPAVEVIVVCEMTPTETATWERVGSGSVAADSVTLPPCAMNGLSALAAAVGVDGWRILGCITNAIEKDTTKSPAERGRARLAGSLAARKVHGR